jgi:RHS repeat-associated protein
MVNLGGTTPNRAPQPPRHPYHTEPSYLWDGTYDVATQITLPEGEVTRFGIDPATGNRVWQEDGRGTSSRVVFRYYTADVGQGLLRAVELPGGAVDSVAYDGLANLAQTWTPLGAWTRYRNDDIGRVRVVQQQITGDATQDDSTEYDVMDRVTRRVKYGPAMNGLGEQRVELLTEYDPAGHVVRARRQALGWNAGSVGVIETRWRYDVLGRAVAEIAPDQTPADTTDNPVDSTVYDAAGNAVEVHTRRGHLIAMTYDALNRLTRRVVPPVWYDAVMKGAAALPGMTEIGDLPYGALEVPGDTVRYWYDRMGRLDSASNMDAKIRRRYYPNGLIWLDSLRIRTYNGANFDVHAYGIEYHYDLDSRRIELRHPAQLARQGTTVAQRTTYGYDPQTGLLARVTDPLGNAFTFAYNARNELIALGYPWGAQEQYTYDLDGNLKTQVLAGLRSTTYEYDLRGKLLHWSNAALLRDQVDAVYSALGQLVYHHYGATGVDQLGRQRNVDVIERFSPDALGNVLIEADSSNIAASSGWGSTADYSRTSRTLTYEPGTGRLAGDAVTARTDSVEYDAAGNTTLRYTKQRWARDLNGLVLPPVEDRASYYAADGRLWGADYRFVEGQGGQTAEGALWRRVREEYRYDPLGRRVLVRTWRTCDYRLDADACHWGTIRRTVWDGAQELWEIQMPGDESEWDGGLENDTALVGDRVDDWGVDRNPYFGRVLYTHGPTIDRPLALTRFQYADHPSIGGQRGRYSGAWPVFTIVPHWNGRGEADLGSVFNVPAPYNGTGNYCRTVATEQHCLDPWWYRGAFAYQREVSGRLGWFGTLVEAKEDGAHTLYRRHRYYDPQSGRFTQEDPLGLAGGLNLYGYADGDPINLSDPFGLCPITKDGIPCTLEWGGIGAAAGLTFGLAAGTVTTAGTAGAGLPVALGEVGSATVLGGLAGGLAGAAVDATDLTVLAAQTLGGKIKRGVRRAAVAIAIAVGLRTHDQLPPRPDPDKDQPPPPAPTSTKTLVPEHKKDRNHPALQP